MRHIVATFILKLRRKAASWKKRRGSGNMAFSQNSFKVNARRIPAAVVVGLSGHDSAQMSENYTHVGQEAI